MEDIISGAVGGGLCIMMGVIVTGDKVTDMEDKTLPMWDKVMGMGDKVEVKVTTMEAWLALAVYIVVVIVWNLVGFLLFNFLEKLSDQLTEEKDQGQETLRDIIKRLQQEQDQEKP